MKRNIFYIVFIASIMANIIYFINLIEQKKHKNEFYSIFKIKETNYEEGYLDFKAKLNTTNNKTPYHLIHIWDTFLVDPTKSIPYFSEIDNYISSYPSKTMDFILMSTMSDETIKDYFSAKKIKFSNVILMNDMDNFISGICNKRKTKTKIHSVNLLINARGDILYYNDEINNSLNKDTLLIKTINSLK